MSQLYTSIGLGSMGLMDAHKWYELDAKKHQAEAQGKADLVRAASQQFQKDQQEQAHKNALELQAAGNSGGVGRGGGSFTETTTTTTPASLAPPPPSASTPSSTSAPEPSPITYSDPEARARGGPALQHGAYLVGEKGPEIFVPAKDGRIIPNHRLPGLLQRATGRENLPGRAGGGNVEAARETAWGHIQAQRVQAAAHERATQAQAAAHIEAQRIASEGLNKNAETTATGHVRGSEIAAGGLVGAHTASAAPALMVAEDARTLTERTRNKTLFTAQDKAYQDHMAAMKAKWQSTIVPQLEAEYRQANGSDMSPDVKSRLLASDDMGILKANKHLGTPEFSALASLGVPREGEPARPGQLMAHGYEPQKDGSWQKNSVNPLSGTPYVDQFVPTADGLTHSQAMTPRKRQQGPGLYREEGNWYGTRGGVPQQVPPRVLSIEQALEPGVVASYNKRAGEHNLPQVGADLVAQNPEGAAWQVLFGVNKMNTSIGRGDPNDYRHLNAPTYVLNDENTKKAMAGHAAWLNPVTTSPAQRTDALINTAAGGPIAPTPGVSPPATRSLMAAAANAPAGGAPEMAAAPAPATVTPVATPTFAETDPGTRNLRAAGGWLKDSYNNAQNLSNAAAGGINDVARTAVRLIPGGSLVADAPKWNFGLQNTVPAQLAAVPAENPAPINNLVNVTPAVPVPPENQYYQ